jgi:hypothetical protein
MTATPASYPPTGVPVTPFDEESAVVTGVVEEPCAAAAVDEPDVVAPDDEVCEVDEASIAPCVDPESALDVDVVDDVSVDDPLLAASEPATVAMPPFDVVCDRNPVASGAWTFASA